MASVLSSICTTLASLGCIYLLAAIVVIRFRKPKERVSPWPEPVTLLKPLYGAEPWLAECLTSFLTQDYRGPVQIVFGVQHPDDPALSVVQTLKERFADLDIEIVVDETAHGANGKVSNLINMTPAAKYDIMIVSDGDIVASPDYVTQVVSLLQRRKAGGASMLYYGAWQGPVWSRLDAAWINTHFLPSVMIGRALSLAKPCFGSTIGLRRQALERIGGFEAFANQLADDYAIGEAVRKAGFALEIGPAVVGHVSHEQSFASFIRHQLRWARTIRSIDLPGYLGSLVSHPFAWALIGAVAGSATCLWLAALALGLRIGLSRTVTRSFEAPREAIWLPLVTDILSFGVFVWSFFGSEVIWKRSSFTVLSDGTLAHSR